MTQLLCLVVGESASDLEKHAADELKTIMERLFSLEVRIATQINTHARANILIGQPKTNQALSGLVGDAWPAMSDQGFVLRLLKNQHDVFLIGGGSDVATLWAVYEFGERLGVRYLHHRDVYPERRAWPELPPLNIVMEPDLQVRCWRLVNEHACGPLSWSLEENKRFLRQLAKMKFNGIRIQLWAAQPFVHYSLRGMEKPKGVIFFGSRYFIDDETVGREKFGNISEFTNPEFVGAETADELHRRAVYLVRGILDEARRLGMQTALAFEPVDWPKAFAAVLPQTVQVEQCGHLTIGPGPNQSMDDPLLREAAATVIDAYLQIYPSVDRLIFTVPEHGHWVGQAADAYQRLISTYQVKNAEHFDVLCARARSRTNFPGGGERVERQLRGDLSSLWFIDSIVRERNLLQRTGDSKMVKIAYSNVTEELFALLEQVSSDGYEVVSMLDYTASRQLQCRDLLVHKPRSQISASLIFTLADDNIGLLPQLATESLWQLMKLLRDYGWSGFHTRYWTIGDLDPTIHLLARGSWDATLTVSQAYTDQVQHVCGPEAVPFILEAFSIIEKITLRLDQYGMGLAFPVPNMMIQHYEAGGLPSGILEDRELYREALRLMEEAYSVCNPDGRDYVRFFVGRLRFAVGFLDAAELFGEVKRVLQKNADHSEALLLSERALEAIRRALQAYVDVAHDSSDLGAIAILNEYCFRPIRDKRNELAAYAKAEAQLHSNT